MAASSVYSCRVRVRKLAVLPGRPPGQIPCGAVFIGEATAPPIPGERFRLVRSDGTNCLITSTVQQLLDAKTFLTRNSIYRFEMELEAPLRTMMRVQRFRRRLVRMDFLSNLSFRE